MTRRDGFSGFFPLALTAAAALLLASCGGGGSSMDGMDGGGSPSGGAVISGSAVKGPVSGATIRAFAVSGGVAGAQIASAVTDANGAFTMPMGNYAGTVMLQMSGGNYLDEATGARMAMGNGDVMTAAHPAIGAGATVNDVAVTPLTAMAQAMAQRMPGGLTDANIVAANAAVGSYFMVHDILHTQPLNPLVPGSANGATRDMMNYGMTLAAMSQYARDAGMASSSGFVTAMMNDASDGVIDGQAAGTPVSMGAGMMGGGSMGGGGMMRRDAGGAGLTAAMTEFMNSGSNRSGLSAADMAALMQRLRDGTGTLCIERQAAVDGSGLPLCPLTP